MKTILLGLGDDHQLTADHLKQIEKIAPDYRLLLTNDLAEITAAIDDIEIAAASFPNKLLKQASNLRWLQRWGAGVDWLLRYPEAQEMDFVLTNASGIHAIPISEHLITFMLTFARQFHRAIRAQSQNEWHKFSDDVFELAGKTMLLIGVGAIGERTAQLAQGLEMRVEGIRRNPKKTSPHVDAMYSPADLLDRLPHADFVIITTPLTEETRGMIDEAELRAMKPTAIISNIGRGAIINEGKLIQALNEGWITGAGLDVFEQEPLPADSPLWQMDNVVITAHYSGSNPHYDERAFAIFIDNLERYVSGKPLRNVVDKSLGY